jgi:hypothetical protein
MDGSGGGEDLREKMARLKSVEAVRTSKQSRLDSELAEKQKREGAAEKKAEAKAASSSSAAALGGGEGGPVVSKRSKIKGSTDSAPLKMSINVGGHEVLLKVPSLEDLEDESAGLTPGQPIWRVDEALTTDFIQKKKELNAERREEEEKLMRLRDAFHAATDSKHQEAFKHRLLIDTIALAQLDEQRTRQALEAEQTRVKALLWELSNRAIRHRREHPREDGDEGDASPSAQAAAVATTAAAAAVGAKPAGQKR